MRIISSHRRQIATHKRHLAASTLATGLLLFGLPGTRASAILVSFSGEDLNAGPASARPNSTAGAASFDAAAIAIGTDSIITFESAAVGSFTSLTVAPGVSVTGSNLSGGSPSIQNVPNYPANPILDGFDTTAGGSHYAEIYGGTLTFTFATPIQFFGAYFTGVQTAFFADNIQFSDGTSQSLGLPGAGTTNGIGAVDFLGFTDPGKSISSITITASNASGADAIGVDDVRYQSVPEPASLTLLCAGAAMLGLRCKRTV